MARQKTTKGEPAKQVAIDVLREAGEPLHAKEIAKRVLESGRSSGLKGKTPEATISAMLAVGSKPGGLFKRVDKGTYALADAKPPAEDAPHRHAGGEAALAQAAEGDARRLTGNRVSAWAGEGRFTAALAAHSARNLRWRCSEFWLPYAILINRL